VASKGVFVNLGNVVRYWSHYNPDGVAVVNVDRRVTWSELHDRTSRLANGLASLGLAKGDRVGILSGNCLEYLEVAIAGYKLGTILVPLNIRLTPHELRYIIEHAGCRALVADEHLAPLGAEALDHSSIPVDRIGLGEGFGVTLDSLRSDDPADPDAQVEAGDVTYICYTSGTTGTPKGAMLTHGGLLAMATGKMLSNDTTRFSRVYLPFPLSFTGGIVSVWAPAYLAGSTLVLDPVVDPLLMLQQIQNQRLTHFAAVPLIFEMMLQHPDFSKYDLSSLQVVGSGGAAVPESLIERLQAVGIPMAQGYGLTESCGQNTWLHERDSRRKIGSCGKPMMQTRIRTVDPENHDALVDVPVGDVGELIIKGPEVMIGYWNAPEATAETLVDGWLRTGDLARIDDEGYIYIVDRAKDMLISGGLNVYPAEIEFVLAAMPGVAECAVIGIPDRKWGETPVALIRPMPGVAIDKAMVLEHCREQLADYKLPRYVVVRDEPLPRGMSGKVLKRELRSEYALLGTPVS
jgi:fatty-acyl-CoA synthase